MVGAQWLSVEESGPIPHASPPPQSWILPSGDGPICTYTSVASLSHALQGWLTYPMILLCTNCCLVL